jgi:uncharacterized membrane protein
MKKIALYLQAIFYIVAGINHFRKPQSYDGLIPPYLPWHLFINLFAGSAEIVLGIALLLPISRKWAAYGIIAMLLAFIPAHIYFIQIGCCIPGGLCVPQWVGWLRLLIIHPLLIAWAWWCRK